MWRGGCRLNIAVAASSVRPVYNRALHADAAHDLADLVQGY